MTYIVVSANEIVKAEMERPSFSAWEIINPCVNKDRLIKPFQEHCLSLPRIAIQGKHNWKVWQEVEESEVRLQHQRRFYFNATDDWFDCDEKSYLCQPVDLRRLIAIPIQPTPEGEKVERKPKIYIASKTKHADKWVTLRKSGVNVISTWIDEAGERESTDLADLCKRCIDECLLCDGLIVYSEEGDYLKGAFIEMGIVLSRYKGLVPIYLVGPVLPYGSAFTYSHQVFTAPTVERAIDLLTNDNTQTP